MKSVLIHPESHGERYVRSSTGVVCGLYRVAFGCRLRAGYVVLTMTASVVIPARMMGEKSRDLTMFTAVLPG